MRLDFLKNLDQIVFYGKFQEQFENKTMVIQIISKGGYILRELSIHGHINDVRSESIFIETIKPYEIFSVSEIIIFSNLFN